MDRPSSVPTVSLGTRHIFLSQLYQVLHTYFVRWYSRVIAADWLFATLFFLWFMRFRPNLPISERLRYIMMILLAANSLLGMALEMKLKSQFFNPRARLLPGFAMAHLMAAGAIAVTAMTLEAAVLLGWGGFGSQLALLSLIFLSTIVGVWAFYRMDMLAFWLVITIEVVLGYLPGEYIAGFVQTLGDHPLLSLLLLCIGLAATVAFGMRLWRVSEETLDYSRMSVIDLSENMSFHDLKRHLRKVEAQVIAKGRRGEWLLDALFRFIFRKPASLTTWRRLVLYQLATRFSGLFLWIHFQMGMTIYCFWIQTWFGERLDEEAIFPIMFMPFLMAMGIMGGMWRNRLPYLARELLLPVGRKDFIRNVFRSGACDVAGAIVGQCVGILIGTWLFHPQGSLDELLPLWLVLTVIQYVVGYCAMLWLVSFRSFVILALGASSIVGLLVGLGCVALLIAGRGFWTPIIILPAVLTIVLTIVIFYRMAFRRWCQIDLS